MITREKLVALAERGAQLIQPIEDESRTFIFQMPDGMIYSYEHVDIVDTPNEIFSALMPWNPPE